MIMSKKRVLFITQEMNPYTALGEISDFVRKLPQKTVEGIRDQSAYAKIW